MPRYSEDLKEQAVKYVEEGNSYSSASKIFGATSVSIKNWHKRYLELGHVGYHRNLGNRIVNEIKSSLK